MDTYVFLNNNKKGLKIKIIIKIIKNLKSMNN